MNLFRCRIGYIAFIAMFTVCGVLRAQNSPAALQPDSARAAHAYETAMREGSPALRAFLTEFPKGADLHVHLSGAV